MAGERQRTAIGRRQWAGARAMQRKKKITENINERTRNIPKSPQRPVKLSSLMSVIHVCN